MPARFRPPVSIAAMCSGLLLAGGASGAVAQAPVTGKLSLLDRNDQLAQDVGQAVVWLETDHAPAAAPARAEMSTEGKQFLPHLVVLPSGSTVVFPNHDPFNHNVFSLSDVAAFDLGLYGRGEGKSAPFPRAGIVRVYCNVHATMSGFIVLRDNPYYTQPGADGSFSIAAVPPGDYTLHAWHERAKEVSRAIRVPADGLKDLELALDARGYKFKSHPNKYGQPYSQAGRRY